MKIILTEAQFKTLMCEERIESLLLESLNESKSFEELKQKIRKALLMGVSVAVIISAIGKMSITPDEKERLMSMVDTEMIDSKADSLFAKKVQAVDDCFAWYAGLHNMKPEDIQLSSEKLVSTADEKGFSLPFAVAQAIVESGFGTASRARRTNSVWSVGSYDNGKNVCNYSTQDDSIAPYMDIVKRDYLGDSKSFDDLLSPGGFVNRKGMRYASNPNYEATMKKMIKMVLSRFPDLGL